MESVGISGGRLARCFLCMMPERQMRTWDISHFYSVKCIRWRNGAACCSPMKYLPCYIIYFTRFNVEAVMVPFTDFVSRNFGPSLSKQHTCITVFFLAFTPLQKHHLSVNTNFRKSKVSQYRKQQNCARAPAHARTTRLHEAEYYSYSLR
jgi:hypothetical protein